jgi:uncharacterized protein YdaT
MPWSPDDASRKTKKADTAPARKQWADIANAVLDKTGDEGSAVRIANAAVKNHKSHEPVGLARATGEG